MAAIREPIAFTKNLTRIYQSSKRRVTALEAVSLSVSAGELVVVRGRSGSGKTTLLNCLGSLDQPTSGGVWVLGQSLASLSEREQTRLRRHKIGFVFQANALLPTYTVAENIDLLLRLGRLNARWRAERVGEVLQMVGLADWAAHRPAELSGGQQQRAVIARAIAPQPALLLADEPTGALDTTTGSQMFGLFRRLAQIEGTAVLIATHDPIADQYAHRTLYLRDGRLDEKLEH